MEYQLVVIRADREDLVVTRAYDPCTTVIVSGIKWGIVLTPGDSLTFREVPPKEEVLYY